MATYILLGNLTEQGIEILNHEPARIAQIYQSLDHTGVRLISLFAVLGNYDIVAIVEAPDNRTIVNVSTELSMQGLVKITTLPALTFDELIEK